MISSTRGPRSAPALPRAFALLTALLLIAASCGSNSSTEAASPADEDTADEDTADEDTAGGGTADSSHDHDAGIEVPDGMAVPTIGIATNPDPSSGVNLFVDIGDFTIAPEHASTDPVDGEGHLHLYVDGEKVMRFYNTALHLTGLDEGDHEITVEVSANDHSPYTVDGEPIRATQQVTVEAMEHSHAEHPLHDVDAASAPTLAVEALEDPKAGWNLAFDVSNLDISAEAASTDHVDGQGHLHLYVDGERIGRIYGDWWHLPTLTEGDHEIAIEAATNSHGNYAIDGEPIRATTTISVSAAQATDAGGHEHGDATDEEAMDQQAMAGDADITIHLSIAGGAVDTGPSDRYLVDVGSTVLIVTETDVSDSVHVHGYDLLHDVEADTKTEFSFVADVPGLFEIELENAGQFLFEIVVE